MSETFHFAEAGRLLSRVAHAVANGEKVTFLFGSALTAPGGVEKPGVPDAGSMVEEVLKSFHGSEEFETLQGVLNAVDVKQQYQEAMKFVLDCRGQDALNDLIKGAVLRARVHSPPLKEA